MLRAPAAVRPRVVMFNMAELSCRYHFDVRYSLIDMPVAFAALLVITNLPDFYRKRTARTVLTGMCYSVGSVMRKGSSSLTRLTGQSAMTSRTWRR